MSELVSNALHAELRALIASSRQWLAGTVNAELTRLYWSVGQRLRTEVVAGEGYCWGTWTMSDNRKFPLMALLGAGHIPAKSEDEQVTARVFYVTATRATQRLVFGMGGCEVMERLCNEVKYIDWPYLASAMRYCLRGNFGKLPFYSKKIGLFS
jgi:hypothetical protein